MKIIDLTHTIGEKMPVFPGTPSPALTTSSFYEPDGFRETHLSLYSHNGTHMDAPAHVLKDGLTLDEMPVSQFAGKALVLECCRLREKETITMEIIRPCIGKAKEAEFLLFHLGWDRRWGKDSYFGEYPCLDDEVIEFILRTGKKGVGFDVLGPDPIPDESLSIHKKLLNAGNLVIIENLKNLEQCGNELFWFLALPLKWENSDGAPVRAVGVWEE